MKTNTQCCLAAILWALCVSGAHGQIPHSLSPQNDVQSYSGQDDKAVPQGAWYARTLGGRQLWTDVTYRSGWRIQQDAMTGHYRLLDADGYRFAWGSLRHCRNQLDELHRDLGPPPGDERHANGQVVILLHGLGRARQTMDSLAEYLQQQGDFQTITLGYASTRGSLCDHAEALASVIENLEGVDEIHFVAHSLGNLVIRRYLAMLEGEAQSRRMLAPLARDGNRDAPPGPFGNSGLHRSDPAPRFGRMVMLGPPNQGSKLADALTDSPIVRAVLGATGRELADDWDEVSQTLATPPFEFAIIAGHTPGGRWLDNPLLEGPDDLFVSVEETKLPGAADFAVMPVNHSQLMHDREVKQAILTFLTRGYLKSPAERHPLEEQ